MLTDTEQLRARYAIGDLVNFRYRRQMLEGTLVRMNPKRAIVRAGDGEFSIPYSRIIPVEAVATKRAHRIESILQMAMELMTQHGLKKWRFEFDHGTRRAGCCNHRDKLISISFNLAQNASNHDIRDTILHEIAHALVGRKHNHDAAWKAKAKEIGCSGERCHRLEFAPPRWKVRCENGCWSHTAQRRNARLVCRKCGGKLVYSTYV